MRNRWVVIVLAFLGCVIAGAAAAQDTGGTLAGRTVDAQGLPLPGVAVTVTGAQGAKMAVSDADGRFTVPFLTPGPYTVHAELQGFAPIDRTDIQVGLGQRIDLPLTLRVGSLQEKIEVVATPPTVDTTSTTIGASLDSRTLSRLPVGRRFSDTLYLAPGVSTGGAVGVANPSVEGSSGLENQYVVDGVNITNGGYGALGSYSIVFGSLGNGTPFDFMQEVQVKTGGYEAEFGQATGGVINVVTKSGSNALKGSAFGYARPFGLESSYDTVTTVDGTVNRTGSQLSDVGGTIGGPIRTDRLFFFGAVDPQWQSDKFIAPDDFPLHSLGEVNRDRHLVNYAGKVTWQPTSSHHFDVSVFGDPAKGDNGPQRSGSLLGQTNSGYSSLEFGGHNQTVHYDGVLNRHLLVEGSFGRALNRIVETPSVNDWQVIDFRVTPTVNSGGLGFYEAGNRSEAWQAQAKGTTIFAAAGEHQVRFGVSSRSPGLQPAAAVHRSDIHRAERPADGHRRRRRDHPRPGLRADLPRASGEPHVLSSDDAELQRVLRRGLVEDRQLADDPARCPLRAGDPVGDADKGLLAQEQLGAAHRRRLGPDEDWQGEGVRQLRPLLRTRAERPGRARSLVGRLAFGRLLRRESDQAGARRHRHDQCHQWQTDDHALQAARGRRRYHRSEYEAELLQRVGPRV